MLTKLLKAKSKMEEHYEKNEKGMIEKAYPNANPDTNAEEILAYLKG